VFAPVALTVAAFDLATAALCLIYLRRVYWESGPGNGRGQEAGL
jgi:hypothetical protein